jgi:hypothetical protein
MTTKKNLTNYFLLPKVEIFWSPQGWAIKKFGCQKV